MAAALLALGVTAGAAGIASANPSTPPEVLVHNQSNFTVDYVVGTAEGGLGMEVDPGNTNETQAKTGDTVTFKVGDKVVNSFGPLVEDKTMVCYVTGTAEAPAADCNFV